MIIRIAVVEDEETTWCQVREFLDRFAREKGVTFQVKHFTDGDGLTAPYRPEQDIILMDIEMPLMDGLTAARLVREQDPEVIIIFLTNLSQYAIQGYSVQAFDYILKPITWTAFSSFLEKALHRLDRRVLQYISISTREGVQKLAVQDISYIEIRSHTLIYHTAENTVCATGRMSDVEAVMAPYHFSRCNSGYLVNLSYVNSIQDHEVILRDVSLPISRSRKKEFTSSLIEYISSHVQ